MFSVILFLVLTSLLVIFATKAYLANRYWRVRGVPHESLMSSFFTNLVRFRREDVYCVLEEFNQRYGLVYGTFSGFTPILRVSSVEGVKDVLIKHFSVLHERTLFVPTGTPLWDNSIIVLGYKKWRGVRHVSGAAFTASKLKSMVPKIQRIANRLTDRLAENAAEMNALAITQAYTLDVIAAIAYGLDLNTLSDPNNPFVVNATQMLGPSLGLTVLTSAPRLIKYLPFVHFPPKHITDFFNRFTSSILKQRRESCEPRIESDILDLWLSEQKKQPEFTNDVIAAQAFTFFIGGFETSAYTLALTLYLLAVRPKLQDIAYEDMRLMKEDTLTFEDYERMKFVQACFLETLRMFPADYIIDRRVVAPCTVAGVPIDAGIGVQIPIPAINRNSDLFPDPYVYRPQRFVQAMNPYSVDSSKQLSMMLSFGDGPKGCVGRRLALLQMTIGLCAILKRFRVLPLRLDTPAGRLPLDLIEGSMFTPMPKQALLLKLERRK